MKKLIIWIKSLYEHFPNSKIGVSVAENFLRRALQLSFNELVYFKAIVVRSGGYQSYWNDARGDKAMVEICLLVVFTTSGSRSTQAAFASVLLACESPEHFWEPNHTGNYVCINGCKYLEIKVDDLSGNIALGIEGLGSHVPNEFREKVAKGPWKDINFSRV